MTARWTVYCLMGAGVITVTLFGCAGETNVQAEDRLAWNGDFAFGPHAVGFRTATLSRAAPTGPRELALSVWYPASATSESQDLRVSDYFQLALAEGQLPETVGLVEEAAFVAAMTGTSDALSPERARRGLDTPVLAQANATPGTGPYPLVLWSSRHSTVLAQAPLAEMLASHGFVVATVWSSAPPLAFLWEERSLDDKLATIEAQTADLEQALEELRRDPMVEGDNILVLAWSYGGQTAARLQEQEPAVRAVVALDANVVPARPEEALDLQSPLLYLVGRDTSERGFDRLQQLTQPWTAVRFTELAHGNFNALEGYLPASLGTDTFYEWSLGGQLAQDGYRDLVRLVTVAALELGGEVPTGMMPIAALEEAAGATQIEITGPS